MTPEQWQRVKDVLCKLDSLAPEERSRFLNGLEQDEPTVALEIRQMLMQENLVGVVPDALPNELMHRIIRRLERSRLSSQRPEAASDA